MYASRVWFYLGLWAIHLLPNHPGSLRYGLPLVAWVPSLPHHPLATPISFVPPLPHLYPSRTIVGRSFCGWVDVPVPLLEASPDFRR